MKRHPTYQTHTHTQRRKKITQTTQTMCHGSMFATAGATILAKESTTEAPLRIRVSFSSCRCFVCAFLLSFLSSLLYMSTLVLLFALIIFLFVSGCCFACCPFQREHVDSFVRRAAMQFAASEILAHYFWSLACTVPHRSIRARSQALRYVCSRKAA